MSKNYDSEDSVSAYLREIGKFSVLTVYQEVELSERMKKGDKTASEELTKHNLRLVVRIAGKYVPRGVLPLSDLIAEGNRGLMTATKYYDHEKGRFSSYAGWWINQAILRALHETRGIKRSNDIYPYLSRLSAILNQLPRNGFSFSQLLGQAMEKTSTLIKEGDPVKGVRLIWEVAKPPLSLDTSLNNADGGTYKRKDFLESHYPNPAETTVQEIDTPKLRKDLESIMLKSLSVRERDVLRLRFGFDDGISKTLQQIADISGITRERIRQIEDRALRKLRRSPQTMALRHYLK